jgi:hypothetical protein
MASARSTLSHRRSKLMGKCGPLDEFRASLHKIRFFWFESLSHMHWDIIFFNIYKTKCLIYLARNTRREGTMELGGFRPLENC